MARYECCESRKKLLDGIRLKPKCLKIENQQPSSEKEKVQRLSLLRGVESSDSKWYRLNHRNMARIRYSLCSCESMRYLLLNNKADKDAWN
jgi:hypothetical protein